MVHNKIPEISSTCTEEPRGASLHLLSPLPLPMSGNHKHCQHVPSKQVHTYVLWEHRPTTLLTHKPRQQESQLQVILWASGAFIDPGTCVGYFSGCCDQMSCDEKLLKGGKVDVGSQFEITHTHVRTHTPHTNKILLKRKIRLHIYKH